jgi:hypothetical protein
MTPVAPDKDNGHKSQQCSELVPQTTELDTHTHSVVNDFHGVKQSFVDLG